MTCHHTTARWYSWTGSDWGFVAVLSAPGLGRVPFDGGRLTCEACGEWLALGPAADESEAVRVELEAARIAAKWAPLDLEPHPTRDGWAWHRDGYFPLFMMDPYNWQRAAGYLAHAIATHQEQP